MTPSPHTSATSRRPSIHAQVRALVVLGLTASLSACSGDGGDVTARQLAEAYVSAVQSCMDDWFISE
ncbi:MAG: hypothetical protein QF464_06070, partial [Myxococcota bacterium]|nr:hypothetical protein [Myxococcota bacterium]